MWQIRLAINEELMEALRPVALAMQRQDALLLDRTGVLTGRSMEQQDMLEEILNSLQPPVTDQLRLPLSKPRPSYLSSKG